MARTRKGLEAAYPRPVPVASEPAPPPIPPIVSARRIVAEVLDGVELTSPVEVADMVELRRRIRERFPAPTTQIEVYFRNREVVRDVSKRVVEVVIEVREPGAVSVLEVREVK